MSYELYAALVKFIFPITIFASGLVIYSAVRSAKVMGGALGQGLRKIAGGTIIHTMLYIIYLRLEKGAEGLLTQEQVRLFYMLAGLIASGFLVWGFLDIYKIAKKLRLFTP